MRRESSRWNEQDVGLFSVLVLILTFYALLNVDVTVLRWWAGVATVLLPAGVVVGFWVGSRRR